MSSATAYLAVATMFALRAGAPLSLPGTRPELIELLENRYGWRVDPPALEKLIRQLDAWGCITIIEDKYAGELLRMYAARTDESLEIVAGFGHQELVTKARSGGVDWFKRVFHNQNFWDDLHRDPVAEAEDVEIERTEIDSLVPASDRVVTLTDNRREIEILHLDIKGLSEEISSNNEASIDLGEEKEIIKGELAAAEVLVSQPSFRLARLTALVLPALRYLAEKFASGAIGELAKRIITALAELG